MDLEALLLPHWAVLKRQTFFDRLAPELQVKALAEALEPLHPREAHEVREWTPPTTRTMLARLDGSLRRGQARPQQVLWTARKGARREVVCVSLVLPFGIELRLFDGSELLRSELLRGEFQASAKADDWRRALAAAGWQAHTPGDDASGPPAGGRP